MTATPIADLIERMLAAGLPHTSVVDSVRVIECLTSRDGERDASRFVTVTERTPAAIRAARYRQNRKQNQAKTPSAAVAMAGADGVTTERDASRDGVTIAPLSILPSLSASKGIQEEKKEVLNTEPREKRTRGARLPDDWTPSEVDRQFAAGRGLRLVEIEIEATKFRNYWTNRTDKQAAKPRWDRAWQNWILSIKGSANGNGKSVIAAQDRLNDKIAEFSEPDLLGGVRGEAGAPHVRLLSSR